jgi:hypothetical protein
VRRGIKEVRGAIPEPAQACVGFFRATQGWLQLHNYILMERRSYKEVCISSVDNVFKYDKSVKSVNGEKSVKIDRSVKSSKNDSERYRLINGRKKRLKEKEKGRKKEERVKNKKKRREEKGNVERDKERKKEREIELENEMNG